MKMVSIRKADIPLYLQSGEFYRSLQDGEEEEEAILVPGNCMKMDDVVNSNEDLRSLLLTLRFWVTGSICDTVLDYALHLPFECVEEILSEFYRDFSVLIHVKALRSAKAPFDQAICSGELTLVQYFLSRGHIWPVYTWVLVAKAGNIEMMKYAVQAGCIIPRRATEVAATKGHLDCLRFLHVSGYGVDPEAITAAAQGGHLDCLIYLHQQGLALVSCFYECAVSIRNLDMLRYLHESGCPWDQKACETAAKSGRIEFLEYMHGHGCPQDRKTCQVAVAHRQVNTVLHLLRSGCPPSDSIWSATGDEFNRLLQCFLETGLPWSATPEAIHYVIQADYLEGLNSLIDSGCPWHLHTTAYIAKKNNLEMLQFAHEKGCPWSDDTCIQAAFWGARECLHFAHTHGAVIAPNMCARLLTLTAASVHSGDIKEVVLECIKYAHQHGGCVLTTDDTLTAARCGNLALVMYLHGQGCAWHPQAAVVSAEHRHIHCLDYILSHGGTHTDAVYHETKLRKRIVCMEIKHAFIE